MFDSIFRRWHVKLSNPHFGNTPSAWESVIDSFEGEKRKYHGRYYYMGLTVPENVKGDAYAFLN